DQVSPDSCRPCSAEESQPALDSRYGRRASSTRPPRPVVRPSDTPRRWTSHDLSHRWYEVHSLTARVESPTTDLLPRGGLRTYPTGLSSVPLPTRCPGPWRSLRPKLIGLLSTLSGSAVTLKIRNLDLLGIALEGVELRLSPWLAALLAALLGHFP